MKSNIKKRYCEHCDGVNSGGFYDDICIIVELKEYQQFLFDNGGEDYGCQVPAKIWEEANTCYGDYGCEFTICDALEKQKEVER
jgi:hypothetical protein